MHQIIKNEKKKCVKLIYLNVIICGFDINWINIYLIVHFNTKSKSKKVFN